MNRRSWGVDWALIALVALVVACMPTLGRAQELSEDGRVRCARSAVRVRTLDAAEGEQSTGSGTIISSDGWILTSFHVVGRTRSEEGGLVGTLYASRFAIDSADSASEAARQRFVATVKWGDVVEDLALLQIVSPTSDARTLTPVPIAESRPQLSEPVFACGFPLDFQTVSVTRGAVAGFELDWSGDVSWIRTDARFNPGVSGGLLLNARGELVGVPTLVQANEGREPVEFARTVSAASIASALRIAQSGRPMRPIGELRLGGTTTLMAKGRTDPSSDREYRSLVVPPGPRMRLDVAPGVAYLLSNELGVLQFLGQGSGVLPERMNPMTLEIVVPRAERVARVDVTTRPAESSEIDPPYWSSFATDMLRCGDDIDCQRSLLRRTHAALDAAHLSWPARSREELAEWQLDVAREARDHMGASLFIAPRGTTSEQELLDALYAWYQALADEATSVAEDYMQVARVVRSGHFYDALLEAGGVWLDLSYEVRAPRTRSRRVRGLGSERVRAQLMQWAQPAICAAVRIFEMGYERAQHDQRFERSEAFVRALDAVSSEQQRACRELDAATASP